ncbi:MAG: type II secretion system protein M [Pseudomonadota bacterium]
MNLASKLPVQGGLKSLWRDFWSARSPQERKLLRLATLVVLLALIYSVLIDPAMQGRARLEKSLPALRLQAADMQALSREAALLAGRTAPVTEPMSKKNIDDSLKQHGINATSIAMVGDFAKVQLDGVPFAALMQCLADMQKLTKVTVADAHIAALAVPGSVNATLTLRQQKAD